MDGENNVIPSDRLNQKVQKHEMTNTGYYYLSMVSQIHKKCLETCLHSFKTTNMSPAEKACLKNCSTAFLNVNISSFYSMNSALVLHDMEKEANNHSPLHLH